MAEEESIVESEETKKLDQFVGRDLLESFVYYLNYIPSTPVERYNILVKSITFGMELLPYYDDPSESNPEKIQENKDKQEKIATLYAESADVLKTEIPTKRTVNYSYVDHGGIRFKVYKIRASEDKDAKEYQILEKDFTEGMNSFITQQHEQHIPKLQNIYNQILHELTQADIVPSVNPTFDQMIKNEIKVLHQGISDMVKVKQQEKTDGKE